MVATREATLRERPPSRRGRGSAHARRAEICVSDRLRPARARDASPGAAVAATRRDRSQTVCPVRRAVVFTRGDITPRASLLLAARPSSAPSHASAPPGDARAELDPLALATRGAFARAERRGRDLLTRAFGSGRRPTAGTPARVPEGASPVAMSDARINNPYAELDGQVRARSDAAPRAREPARAPSPGLAAHLASPAPPRPNRHFDPVLLSRRPLAGLRPRPPPSSSPQVEQLLRGVIISEEEVRVICEKVKEILAKEENVVPVAAPVTVVRKPVPRTKQNERPSSHVSRSTGWRRSPARGSRDRSSAVVPTRARACPAAGPSPSPTTAGPRAFRWTRLSAPAPPLSTPPPIGGVPSSRPRDVRARRFSARSELPMKIRDALE